MSGRSQGSRARRSGVEDGSPDPGPWAMVAMGVSVAFLLAGVIWPGIAGSLLRVLLAGLALGFLASRALGAGLPSARVHDSFSPFVGTLAQGSPPSTPDVIRRRARMLALADEPGGPEEGLVPWPVLRGLLQELVGRLENGHGLRLEHPAQAARVREMVSAPTRTLLGLSEPPGTGEPPHPEDRFVRLADLDDILDDLERL